MSPVDLKTRDENSSAYSEAVSSGRYVRETGIHGKYDNVRLYWEDESTRIFLRPHVAEMVRRKVSELKRIRILDLGCGSGDGLEMFLRMRRKNPGVAEDEARLILPDHLGSYQGVDINEPLLEQARQRWRDTPKAEFRQGDFSGGLPFAPGERPFDIYFTSYGTLSHLDEDQTVRLFVDIVKHAEDGAMVVGDWLGCYSYEWQSQWSTAQDREHWMEYVISYIYPMNRRPEPEKLSRLRLRLLGRQDVIRIIQRVARETGSALELKELFDRSLLVGRHIDTAEYNFHARPLRRVVNSLHEDNQRTHLEELNFDYQPRDGFEAVSAFFEEIQVCWNALVRFSIELLQRYDDEKECIEEMPEIPPGHPEPLRRAMVDMRRVVEGTGWFAMGDPRANVIEPQLGYALRGLELALQRGMGAGHGLVGVFEVHKS